MMARKTTKKTIRKTTRMTTKKNKTRTIEALKPEMTRKVTAKSSKVQEGTKEHQK